jgi:hypothetical protein
MHWGSDCVLLDGYNPGLVLGKYPGETRVDDRRRMADSEQRSVGIDNVSSG